jgi:hypothetical protein
VSVVLGGAQFTAALPDPLRQVIPLFKAETIAIVLKQFR